MVCWACVGDSRPSVSGCRLIEQTRSQLVLCGVVGVDADVLVRQVGRPELAGAGSLVKIDADGELWLLNVGVGRGFVVFRRAATIAADRKVAKGDVDAFGVDLRAGISDC